MTHILNSHFDKIYLLYISPREYNKIKPKLTEKNIAVQYFKGYNGRANKEEFDIYLTKHIKLKRTNKTIKLLTHGAFGHINSMIMILSDAIKNSYRKILILEPDVYFCKDFENRVVPYLEMDYKLLYLGAYQYKFFFKDTWPYIDTTYKKEMMRETGVKAGYYRPYMTLGTFAVGIDNSLFVEYRNMLQQMNMTSDVYITKLQYKYRDESIVCYPNLICCDLTRSSTTLGRKQIPMMKNLRWNMIPYDLTDYHTMRTMKGMQYVLDMEINSFLPDFTIYIISLPTTIIIDKKSLYKYKKNGKIQITFIAADNKAVMELRNIFINSHKLTATNRYAIRRRRKISPP